MEERLEKCAKTSDDVSDLRRARLAQGAIEISCSALISAYGYANDEFFMAVQKGDFSKASEWRSEIGNLGAAIRGSGYVPEHDRHIRRK